jgi:alanine-synthesizing transaminase
LKGRNVQVSTRWKPTEEKADEKKYAMGTLKLSTKAGPSAIDAAVADATKAKEKILALVGGDPIRFGFHPAPYVRMALAQAAFEGWNMYAAGARGQKSLIPIDPDFESGMYMAHPDALPRLSDTLKELIAAREKTVHETHFEVKDIYLSPGTTQIANMIYLTLFDPGDELVGPEPTYQQYFNYAEIFNAKIVTAPCDEGNRWQPEVDELRKKITERTKGIILVNPNNPTGAVYDENSLKQIADLAGEFDLPIISDEIYDQVTFDVEKAASMAEIAKDVPVMVINGMAKLFMCTGWRVGYLALHDPENKIPHIRAMFDKIVKLSGDVHGVATPITFAAVKAYQNLPEAMAHCKKMVSQLKVHRDLVYRRMNQIPGISCTKPEGAFYAFPRVDGIGKIWADDEEFIADVVREERLMMNPGVNWGPICGPKHFRFVFLPKPAILEDACNRLERFMKMKLK